MNRALARALILAVRSTDVHALPARWVRRCLMHPRAALERSTSWATSTEETLPGVSAAAAVPVPDVPLELLSTTVAISQIVLPPVPALAFGVAPDAGRTWSSASSSMSDVFDTLTRAV